MHEGHAVKLSGTSAAMTIAKALLASFITRTAASGSSEHDIGQTAVE